MARTLLTYSVMTEDVWSKKKNAIVRKIVRRGFDFSVSGVKGVLEEGAYLDSFVEYLWNETGIDARFGYHRAGKKVFDQTVGTYFESVFVFIPIKTMEEKDKVRGCYRKWKRDIKPYVANWLK